jgi:hypothetical protein
MQGDNFQLTVNNQLQDVHMLKSTSIVSHDWLHRHFKH